MADFNPNQLGVVELYIINKLVDEKTPQEEIDELIQFDESYYDAYKPVIKFIEDTYNKFGHCPTYIDLKFRFDVPYVDVSRQSVEYLSNGIRANRMMIRTRKAWTRFKDSDPLKMFQSVKDLQKEIDDILDTDISTNPLNIIKETKKRADQVYKYSKQSRIPTGFDEIDKLMYGGLSTVEELLLIVARTNSGKSWVCTKMMESAQKHGFPVLYYSPEMQASLLATRFDTWRTHIKNSQLFQGQYDDNYKKYLDSLKEEATDAWILEDKDVQDGEVDVPYVRRFVAKHKVKLVIIDGLSYMTDSRSKYNDRDYEKYKNLCKDLFQMSKEFGCAVVISMQANRDTKDMKDEKGVPFPNMFSIEGSDHPGRIATQVFAIRQIFETHTLDIRLEKSRMANNQKPTFSYSWDVNTGTVELAGEGESSGGTDMTPEPIQNPSIISTHVEDSKILDDDDNLDDWDTNISF